MMEKINCFISIDHAILPKLDHITLDDWQHVYEPAEDTFLLCDAILADMEQILAQKPHFAVEVGCGSGCAIVYLATMMQQHQHYCQYVATDINNRAADVAFRTMRANKVEVDVVLTRFCDGLKHHLSSNVDILLFNPPYVPTPDEEVYDGVLHHCSTSTSRLMHDPITAAWAGGRRGRMVIDQFLPQIHELLSPVGRCYMVLVEENDPKDITNILAGYNLTCVVVKRRRARNESLMIVRITRTTST